MTKRRLPTLIAFFTAAAAAALGHGLNAQAPRQPTPSFRAAVDIVSLNVTAMDPTSGKKSAQQALSHGVYSGVTSTAGGLVFTTTVNGTVYALDDVTLKPLWSFNTGSLSSAPPMTYSVNGKQYVAVLIGGNVIARDMLNKTPGHQDVQNTSMLYVFGL